MANIWQKMGKNEQKWAKFGKHLAIKCAKLKNK
jgi:hypothetical protein